MRYLPIPIVVRTANDQIVMDVRTMNRNDFAEGIVGQLRTCFAE